MNIDSVMVIVQIHHIREGKMLGKFYEKMIIWFKWFFVDENQPMVEKKEKPKRKKWTQEEMFFILEENGMDLKQKAKVLDRTYHGVRRKHARLTKEVK